MARKLTFSIRNVTPKTLNYHGFTVKTNVTGKESLAESIAGMSTSVILKESTNGGVNNDANNSITTTYPVLAILQPGQEILAGLQFKADVVESIIEVTSTPKFSEYQVVDIPPGTNPLTLQASKKLSELTIEVGNPAKFSCKTFSGGLLASGSTSLGRLPVGPYPNTDNRTWIAAGIKSGALAQTRTAYYEARIDRLVKNDFIAGETTLATYNGGTGTPERLVLNADGTEAMWIVRQGTVTDLYYYNGTSIQCLNLAGTTGIGNPMFLPDGSQMWTKDNQIFVNPAKGPRVFSMTYNTSDVT